MKPLISILIPAYNAENSIADTQGLTTSLTEAPIGNTARSGTFRVLGAIFVLALLLRVLWMLIFVDSANNEGIYYLRLAENLAAGKGYIGLRENGLQLLYPPLFPCLIAGLTGIVGNAELAARVINMLAGSVMILPVFFIGKQLGSRRLGILAAILVAIHPFFISMATVILSETVYMLLIMSGLYAVIRAGKAGSVLYSVLAGLCFGLAYLTRPEALLIAVIAAVGLGVIWLRRPLGAMSTGGLLFVTTALVIAPYIAWLSNVTGEFLLESKSADNYATKSQLMAHVPAAEIFYGLNDDLTGKGSSMISNLEEIKKWHLPTMEAAKFALGTAAFSIPAVIVHLTTKRIVGNPVFILLAAIGFISGVRRRESWITHGALLAAVGAAVLALLLAPTQMFQERYIFPCVAPMLVWCGEGLLVLAEWANRAMGIGSERRWPYRSFIALGLLSIVIIPLPVVRTVPDFQQGWGDHHLSKSIGYWLLEHSSVPHPRIMDVDDALAYYAGGVLEPFPYADADKALDYIKTRKIDYLVLSSQSDSARPYLADWKQNGIPGGHAKLVYQATDPKGGEVQIYRWNDAAG
jgi:4-amino-4-deoxy-L-arabinose transferase-like glycosyltransferase